MFTKLKYVSYLDYGLKKNVQSTTFVWPVSSLSTSLQKVQCTVPPEAMPPIFPNVFSKFCKIT